MQGPENRTPDAEPQALHNHRQAVYFQSSNRTFEHKIISVGSRLDFQNCATYLFKGRLHEHVALLANGGSSSVKICVLNTPFACLYVTMPSYSLVISMIPIQWESDMTSVSPLDTRFFIRANIKCDSF